MNNTNFFTFNLQTSLLLVLLLIMIGLYLINQQNKEYYLYVQQSFT